MYLEMNAVHGGKSRKTTLVVETTLPLSPLTAQRTSKRVYLDRAQCPEDEFQRSVWDASVWGDRGVYDPLPRLRIDGIWYGSPYIELAETADIQSSTGWLSTDETTVAPVEEQGEWESRKLWHGVAKGIREGDFETAATFKRDILLEVI
ncbi:hypothetical protein EDB19DRAFT_2023869 [Suillus lakei]|nr:hypothetical protein EDB19DRAFT_2023869 [Suillus lakei]